MFVFTIIFFYKKNTFKNYFYKNYNIIYLYTSIISNYKSNFFRKDLISTLNLLFSNKLNFFQNDLNLFLSSFWTNNKSNLLEIPDDFKDIFESVFLKKSKIFFFKQKFSRNINLNFLNVLMFNNSFQFEKNFYLKEVLKNSTQLNSIFFSNKNIYFNYCCNFFIKLSLLILIKKYPYNLNNLIFKNLKTNHFKKKAFYTLKNFNIIFYKKKLFFKNFFTIDSVLFTVTKQFDSFIFFKENENLNTDFMLSDLFLKNFFLKNYFIFNKNILKNFSTNMFNSYFYNCFFQNTTTKSDEFKLSVYTNNTPYNILSDSLKSKIISKINVNYVPNFYRYVYYILSNSLEFFSKKKLFLKIFSKSQNDSSISKQLDLIFFKNRSVQNRIGRGFFLHEMLDVIYTTFFYKDLNFLIKWFIKTMHRISFLSHKKFISAFKQIITTNSNFFIKNNNIRGFFFDIRGKVGVTGDSKKRHVSFYVGDFSKTTKKFKFDYQFDVSRTYTGALGVTMYLCYE